MATPWGCPTTKVRAPALPGLEITQMVTACPRRDGLADARGHQDSRRPFHAGGMRRQGWLSNGTPVRRCCGSSGSRVAIGAGPSRDIDHVCRRSQIRYEVVGEDGAVGRDNGLIATSMSVQVEHRGDSELETSATTRIAAELACVRVAAGGACAPLVVSDRPGRIAAPGPSSESGRGQARPGPSHTTRHAGPHRAVRSAFPETTVRVEESFQTGGLVPVGVGQGPLEWPGPSDAPVAFLRRRP